MPPNAYQRRHRVRLNRDDAETLDALAGIEGLTPNELAGELLRGALAAARSEPDVAAVLTERRGRRLRLVG